MRNGTSRQWKCPVCAGAILLLLTAVTAPAGTVSISYASGNLNGKATFTSGAGSLKITLDNTQQSISIEAVTSIELKAAQIKLQGVNIDIEGTAAANFKSSGICNINGSLVKIN